LIGISSGVLAALKRNTYLDFIPMAIAMIGICVPTFLMGPLLVLIFGINLEMLPVSGWGQLPGDKILPSITLGFAYAAYIARLSRGGMLEVLNQDFIRTARSKGLKERNIVIPGLGRFYVEAAFNRDYTMILGTTIFFSAMIVFFNLLSDLAAMWLNPRSRDVS
jgi:oligopeptide transport system permease protein